MIGSDFTAPENRVFHVIMHFKLALKTYKFIFGKYRGSKNILNNLFSLPYLKIFLLALDALPAYDY